MPDPLPLTLAGLLLAPAVAALAAEVPPGNPWRPPGIGDPVAVYRGTRANVPSTVPVYRGTSAATADPAPVDAPAAVGGAEFLAAGNRLWIVDRDAGTLTACRLGPTYQVGRDRVRCAARELPDE